MKKESSKYYELQYALRTDDRLRESKVLSTFVLWGIFFISPRFGYEKKTIRFSIPWQS